MNWKCILGHTWNDTNWDILHGYTSERTCITCGKKEKRKLVRQQGDTIYLKWVKDDG